MSIYDTCVELLCVFCQLGILIAVVFVPIYIMCLFSVSFFERLKDLLCVSNNSVLSVIQNIVKHLYETWFNKVMGANNIERFVRILLFNWIFLTNLCLLFTPPEIKLTSSLYYVLALNVWVFGNVFFDYLSVSYTVKCIRKYLSQDSTIYSAILYATKDLFVASLCVYGTLVLTNVAYIFQNSSATPTYRDFFGIFRGFDILFVKYNIYHMDQVLVSFPGIFVSVITSYMPTILFYSLVITLLLVVVMQEVIRKMICTLLNYANIDVLKKYQDSRWYCLVSFLGCYFGFVLPMFWSMHCEMLLNSSK